MSFLNRKTIGKYQLLHFFNTLVHLLLEILKMHIQEKKNASFYAFFFLREILLKYFNFTKPFLT